MKNILVTGATGNLGSAVVKKFLHEGYKVTALVSPGKILEQQANLFSYTANLMDEDAVLSIVDKIIVDHKSIHAAVLTVGGFALGSIESTSAAAIQKLISLNFKTAYHVIRPLIQNMKNMNEGRIVMVGSRTAVEPSRGKATVSYSISKSMIFTLSDLINADGLEKNIKSTVIIPDIIDTLENRKDMPSADYSKWTKPAAIADIIYEFVTNKEPMPVIKLY